MENITQAESGENHKISAFQKIIFSIWIILIMFLFVIINGTWISLRLASYVGLKEVLTIIVNWIQPLFTANYLG